MLGILLSVGGAALSFWSCDRLEYCYVLKRVTALNDNSTFSLGDRVFHFEFEVISSSSAPSL